jgi:hypothetical protein
VDAPTGSVAIAAAAVVAHLLGVPVDEPEEEVAAWVAAHPGEATSADIELAVQAISRVEAGDSELASLWEESGPDEWRAQMADLRTRLESPRTGT